MKTTNRQIIKMNDIKIKNAISSINEMNEEYLYAIEGGNYEFAKLINALILEEVNKIIALRDENKQLSK